jgi:uncharacterized protein (TIGR02147 family)
MQKQVVNIFEFREYKTYLQALTGSREKRNGVKIGLARAAGCQSAYVSQVLYGTAQFSLEQAERVARFLGLTAEELDYFFLLVQAGRSGSAALVDYFQKKIQQTLDRRLNLVERLGKKKSINESDQAHYFSSWKYGAIHVALTVPSLRTPKAIASYFHLPSSAVAEALDFLLQAGFAKINSEGEFVQAEDVEFRLGRDSKELIRHHTNLRLQAIEALERESPEEMHYSAIVSLSLSDALKIKQRLLELVGENARTVRSSKEETVYAMGLDFFCLKKT